MTELLWDGKYKDGESRARQGAQKTAPVRIALPFQTIETLNESAADRQKRLDSLFNQKPADSAWQSRLIWGDKKYVLPSLLPEFAGKVNLIYIDPPFNVGSDFSFTATLADAPDGDADPASFTKQPSIIEQKAYRDTWGRGLDSYLQWFYETALLCRELLAETGIIYVHLDWHVGHYAKCVLDEVFGYENFRNEIVWWYYDKFPTGGNVLDRQHDTIFQYSKSEKFTTNKVTEQRVEPGRPTEVRRKVDGKIVRIRNEETGKNTFIDGTTEKKISDVWRMALINSMSSERIGYATQKPEALLERVIKASSNEGDLVLDCFCGSGTTAAVAEKLGRRWITCDLGRFAIHTARKRLLGISGVKPFVVQNLGKYERQAWIQAEFERPESRLEQEKAYRKFILDLYHAAPLAGYVWLHGAKAGRLVHIGGVETPVTVEDVKSAVVEFWKLVGKAQSATTAELGKALKNGIDMLGREFAFDVNETAKQYAAQNKVDVKFKKIPREVLEQKAVAQGDIKFYELASLVVKSNVAKGRVSLTLENFIVPPDDVPPEIQGGITHWSQWVDYWSVDWNYRNDTFHNEWQSYRTKQSPKLALAAEWEYEEAGAYQVLVKVIDILGNDTTKLLKIEIK